MNYQDFASMSTSDLLLTLFINLVITAAAYLLFPLIFAVMGKKYEKKAIRKIAFINAFVVYILFIMLNSAIGDGNASIGAFVLWGSVGYFLLEKNCLSKEKVDMLEDTPICKQDHGYKNQKQKVAQDSCSNFGMKSITSKPKASLQSKNTSSSSQKQGTPSIATVADKIENYAIINSSLATGFRENARQKIKLQIQTAITEYQLVRKTDLMKIIFGNISQEFAEAQGSRTDLVVSAYYQVAFDEMLASFGDQNDLMHHYAVFKSGVAMNSSTHKYLQMIVRMQCMIDDAISSSKKCDAFHGYARKLKANIFDQLNAYIDDTSDWNRL